MAGRPKGSRPTPEPKNLICGALGRVLGRRFDDGLAQGTKRELGMILGEVDGREVKPASASVKVSKLLAGRLPWPDDAFERIAEFTGLTAAGLMREVALELDKKPKD